MFVKYLPKYLSKSFHSSLDVGSSTDGKGISTADSLFVDAEVFFGIVNVSICCFSSFTPLPIVDVGSSSSSASQPSKLTRPNLVVKH